MNNGICFIITSLSSGGAEHQLMELANGLVDKGFNVEITTFADMEDHYSLDNRIKRIRIKPKKSKLIKLLSLWKHALTNKNKFVFCFGQRESFFLLLPMLFSKKKFIVGERNTNLGKLSLLSKFKLWLLYKRANKIIPNSNTQAQNIRDNFHHTKDKIVTITNYTDIDQYAYSYHKSSPEYLRICIFARYSIQKNYRRFAEAIKEVKELSEFPFHVDWYGNKKKADADYNPHYIEFKELLNQYNISDVVTLNDSIKDVANHMKEYDAFCLPSIHEGFSNSISEAISCGLPAIVSDVSDNSIMVKDGINGFLFNPLDVSSIRDSILKFMKLTKSERISMSLKSREIAESLFDKSKFINKYIELFNI